MSFSNVSILTKKLESLPEDLREKLALYLSEHFEDLKDELLWDEQFAGSSEKLSGIASQARQEIAAGKAEPFSLEKL
jgi:hypothetical protein